MRRIVTKSLAVLATTAAFTVAGAGIASADTTVDEDNNSSVSKQTDVRDSGNINVEDLADLGVDLGDLGVLSGNDTDVSDIGNGDNANGNASGNESNSSTDTSTDEGQDNDSGLLGGLL